MPVIYREDDGSYAWGTMAIVLVVALFALLIGYFAWWQPRVNASSGPDVHIVQPAPQQTSPSVIPVPVPGPQGPAGPSGAAGPAGPAGPAGASAPAAPSAPSTPSTGSSSDTGSSSGSSSSSSGGE